MTGWKKSTGEGSICRTNRAGANLTYFFVASEKSEGVQMGKRPLMDEVEEYKYSHEVQRSANCFPLKTGSPDAVDVAPDALHRASGDTQRLTVPASDRSPDATS